MRGRNADVDQQFRHVFSLLEQLFTPPTGSVADRIFMRAGKTRKANWELTRAPFISPV